MSDIYHGEIEVIEVVNVEWILFSTTHIILYASVLVVASFFQIHGPLRTWIPRSPSSIDDESCEKSAKM